MTHNQLNWEDALWRAGYRVTRQRALILDAICAGRGHTPLSDIYGRVRKVDPSVDRSTVYRTIKVFTDAGIVVSADTGGAELTYEITGAEPHHHLVCRACHGELEFDDTLLDGLNAALLDRYGFRVETDHVVLFGTCAICRNELSAKRAQRHVSQSRQPLRDLPDRTRSGDEAGHA